MTGRLRDDLIKLRGMDGPKRLAFVWDYYKLPVLSAVLVVMLAVTALMNLDRAQTALYVVMVNANNEADGDEIRRLLTESGADTDGKDVNVETGYTLSYESPADSDIQTIQVLAALFGIGDMDVFAADEAVFKSYADKDAFVDLSLFIPADLLQAHEAGLYRYANADGHEITGGIRLSHGSPLHNAGYYSGGAVIGIPASAVNLDNAINLLTQIIKTSIR
jgi:hypothetical protein